jgi:hypothetical protein
MSSELKVPEYLSSWMSSLPSHLRFRNLIIPGSHASNSNNLYKPKWSLPFTKCQQISISQQLKSGIRYLDFKYGVRKDKIYDMLNINK